MERTPLLAIGDRFGRFAITDVLPGGGQGEVYRAHDSRLQRDVAIKLVRGAEPHARERFIREAQTAAGFSHPHIVRIFEVGTEQYDGHDVPYLVMEFIDGATLRDRMRHASEDRVVRWLSEIAEGLAALHTRRVMHRDLKPTNIMIGTDDRARIVDFGLAKAAGTTVTSTGTIVGTLDYFSPEQTDGLRRLDYRTDIFSFGIVLYEALTGTHPFRRATDVNTLRAIQLESPDRIRGRVGEIVARCLQKQPGDRYDDAADIARDLRELLPEPTPHAVAPVLPARVDPDATTVKMRTARPTRRWWWVALLAAIVLAVIATAYQKRMRDTERVAQPKTGMPTVVIQPVSALPSCALSGSPGTITYGGSARLNWSSENGVDAVISPAIGLVGPNGSIDVSPKVTTTYYFLVSSAEGIVAESSITLVVTGAPADVKTTQTTGSITASPAVISRQGEVAMLAWNSTDATHVVISPSIGIVPLRGRIQVAPPVTTTYTMTISNDSGGSAGRGSATVYVTPGAKLAGEIASPEMAMDCVAATQEGISGTSISDSTSCSVPAHRTIRNARLNYTLDDGGSISINGRSVFTKTPGVGAREGTLALPVDLFAPDKSFLLKVEARNAVNPDGTLAGAVYGKAAVHLDTRDAMAGLEMGVTPSAIQPGQTALLNWSTVDAPMLVLNPLTGVVAPKAVITVSPTQTTTYTLRGWSAGGDPATAHVTLEVQ
jgi:predicted Ser/Thr protein kinase